MDISNDQFFEVPLLLPPKEGSVRAMDARTDKEEEERGCLTEDRT